MPSLPRPAPLHAAHRALGQTARFLITTPEAGVEAALDVLGRALGARAVSFTPAPGGGVDALRPPATWTAPPDTATGTATTPFDVSVLTDGLLAGRLRVEVDAGDVPAEAYRDALAPLADVLGAHLERRGGEAADGAGWRVLDVHPAPTVVLVGGHVTYANRAAALLFGVAGGDALRGRALSDLQAAGEGNAAALDPAAGSEGGAVVVFHDDIEWTGAGRAVAGALEEQRERIGRDLHDSIGPLLTAVRMLSEGIAAPPRPDPSEDAETAGRIAVYAAEALDRVRDVGLGLAPPPFDAGGVAGALADLAAHVDALGPARCVFRRDGDADVDDPAVALQVYRVVQEATTNALRHAHAETVRIRLGRDGGDLVVEVVDDGVGFDADAPRSRSLGLENMAWRARSVGASLTVEGRPGAGTEVRLVLPLAAGGAAGGARDGGGG
ncbi:sensor histidine kinase [Rubrivirga litoralis]|uniref:Histidine kinase n=1 Tax=Rubrivirga litoralis TaxID=3075598 RepID=A0ABU3BPK5_9BACT|nr:ATP-binding protein [Rubrivirga sp. F394]MDT0631217.1 histidine kinase [Rubrivirga sp. F394]